MAYVIALHGNWYQLFYDKTVCYQMAS